MKRSLLIIAFLFLPLAVNAATISCYRRVDLGESIQICNSINPLPGNCIADPEATRVTINNIPQMRCNGLPEGFNKQSATGGNTQGVYTNVSNTQTNPTEKTPSSNLSYTPLEPLPGIDYSGVNFPAFLSGVIKILIILGCISAVLMITFYGIMYMTSSSAGRTKDALDRVKAAFLGLLLLIASVLILREINPGLLNFNLSSLVNLQNGRSSAPDFSAANNGTIDCSGGGC